MDPTSLATGNALSTDPLVRWCLGTVLEYYPLSHTYRVKVGEHGTLNEVGRLLQDPGDNSILPVDTVVVLHRELGFWVIHSILKQTPNYGRELNQVRVSEIENLGGESAQHAQATDAASYRGAGDPKDILPNDWIRHSGDGNFVGVLAGGMNVLHSSPVAQVRTHSLTNLVEVIAHEYKHVSSMGDFEIRNNEGKTNLSWRAGSDQTTETGANTENWTFWLDAGAVGDLFRFRITAPHGKNLAEIHVSAQGKMQIFAADGIDVTGRSYREDVIGPKASVVQGDRTDTTSGDAAHTINGERTTLISKNDTVTMGGGYALNVTGNSVQTIGGFLHQAMAKSSRFEVTNGYLDIVVGDIAKNPTIIPGSTDLYLHNVSGSVNIEAMPGAGTISLYGSAPGSINLGADAIPNMRSDGSSSSKPTAPYSAVMFEFYKPLVESLIQWLDTHTHPTAMGPSSVATTPSSPTLKPMIPQAQSLRVKIGG